MLDGLYLCSLSRWLLWIQPTLGFEQMGCKDGVHHSRLAQSGLTNDAKIELKATFEQLVFNLLGDAECIDKLISNH